MTDDYLEQYDETIENLVEETGRRIEQETKLNENVEFVARVEDLGGVFDVDGTPTHYIVRPGALQEGKEVPLTMYIGGKRHIIGTAVVKDGSIHATLADTRSNEVTEAMARESGRMAYSISMGADFELDEVATVSSYQKYPGIAPMPESEDIVAQVRKLLRGHKENKEGL